MNIIRNIRTPIMSAAAVEATGILFVGCTIADDTSGSMGEPNRNSSARCGYLKEAERFVSLWQRLHLRDGSVNKKEIDAA